MEAYDPSYFNNIPDEILYSMCEGWENKELLNMSQAYSRVLHVCDKIIEKRKFQNKIKEITPKNNMIRKVIKIGGVMYIRTYKINEILLEVLTFQAGNSSPNIIFIPKIRTFGHRDTLSEFLLTEGFTEDEVNFLINEAITKDNYSSRELEFIKTFKL